MQNRDLELAGCAFNVRGDDFDALMARYQDQPGIREAREIGWVKRNQLPEVLRDAPERVVVVYGETAPADPAVDARRRRLVRWSAVRPGDGATFDRLVRPEGTPPVPEHLQPRGEGGFADPVNGNVPERHAGASWYVPSASGREVDVARHIAEFEERMARSRDQFAGGVA